MKTNMHGVKVHTCRAHAVLITCKGHLTQPCKAMKNTVVSEQENKNAWGVKHILMIHIPAE